MPLIPGGGGFQVPAATSPDRSHGLLKSIIPINLADPHWQAGIEWESDCSVDVFSTLPPCTGIPPQKDTDGALTFCSADPFTVYGVYKCSPTGRTPDEAKQIATNRLNKNKERGVEKIFWTGATQAGQVSPSLQGGNTYCDILPKNITPANALTPTAAIAALESSIAECVPGGIGVIHVNFGFLPFMAANFLLTEKDGNFYTPSGQLVIAGAGYPGSGPANTPAVPGETWVFATGPVSVYQSKVFYTSQEVSQVVNRSINDITYTAEQTFAVFWECCVFAVRSTLC